MQSFPLFVSRVVPVITLSHCLRQRRWSLHNTPCQIDLRSGCHLRSQPFGTLSRREISDRPPAMPRGYWFRQCSRDVMLTGRIDQADPMKQVYYNEGWSGPNKYTFEVYQLENGRCVTGRWPANGMAKSTRCSRKRSTCLIRGRG